MDNIPQIEAIMNLSPIHEKNPIDILCVTKLL